MSIEYQGKTKTYHFDVKGGFLHERFFQVEYRDKNKNTIQFGSMVFELDAEGGTLTGRCVGYGVLPRSIISGAMECHKT